LYQLFKKTGHKVGLLSTVKIMVGDIEYQATHTTPDSVTINHYLWRWFLQCYLLFYGSEVHMVFTTKKNEALHLLVEFYLIYLMII
jgi:hypothetical protein